ncbi:MAG: hypothetical protein Q9222_005504 [Ikaeria aurantiellina]
MGNTSTKEQRAEGRRHRRHESLGVASPSSSGPSSPSVPPPGQGPSQHMYSNSRAGRGSRPDLSALLGLGSQSSHSSDNTQTLETRREAKQEKEARRVERERFARLQERERSMREEHVDGGYLVTHGVYAGPEDFNKIIVRQLMIERRLAPFWRGLNEFSESWTENQLIAAARGLPIPAPDEIPKEEETGPFAKADPPKNQLKPETNLTIPITSRSASYTSDSSGLSPSVSQPLPIPDLAQPTTSSGIFRGRAKTLASLTTGSKHPGEDFLPAEIQLPRDPYFNGQRIEAFLYKDTFEYPHLPEHTDPSAPPPPPTNSGDEGVEGELTTEHATCPFCKQEQFGVTYEPPPFRRGLAYVNQPSIGRGASAMSSSTSLSSGLSGGQLSPNPMSRRRTTSISAADAAVITTDRIRPEWYFKLMAAREAVKRRASTANALHNAAYSDSNRALVEGRFGGFGRRGLLRRGSGPDFPTGGNMSAHASMMALLSERHAAGTLNRIDGHEWTPTGPGGIAPPRGSSRRNRMDDIEDMMMMEAIRLSLASEEERRKQEDKATKKEAKKAEKEAKKEEKVAKKEKKAAKKAEKAGLYPSSADQSTTGLSSRSETSLTTAESSSAAAGKGKATQRPGTSSLTDPESSAWAGRMPRRSETDVSAQNHPFVWESQADAQTHLERARAQLNPELQITSSPYGAGMQRPSHLRTASNVSSSASSLIESLPGSLRNHLHGSSSSLDPSPNASGVNLGQSSSTSEGFLSGAPSGGGSGLEPMFNFRSLAAMIGKDDEPSASSTAPISGNSRESSSSSSAPDQAVDVPVVGTQRSDSMTTVQPNDEFHETSEYLDEEGDPAPRNSLERLSRQGSGNIDINTLSGRTLRPLTADTYLILTQISSQHVVHSGPRMVKNIANQTSEKEVRDFFSFCGKITSLSVTPSSDAADSPQSATVTFEKETAAKTALLLDNTQLGSSQVQVSSAANLDDLSKSTASTSSDTHGDHSDDLTQEDKPRSRIVAEYLAHGYTISDNAIQRAIALDNKHGVSNRFTTALTTFDSKTKASDRARGLDASYGISEKASRGWAGLSSYFEKAVNTPTGQKLAAFYTQSDKQVRDIHAEARRLADIKGGKPAQEGSKVGGTMEANEKSMETVPGTEGKTTCNCGGDTGVCPCGEGKCACSGCAKSGMTGEKTATGPADQVAASSGVQPLGEKYA